MFVQTVVDCADESSLPCDPADPFAVWPKCPLTDRSVMANRAGGPSAAGRGEDGGPMGPAPALQHEENDDDDADLA